MAIVARETIVDPSWNISIRAVDLNPAALEKYAREKYLMKRDDEELFIIQQKPEKAKN